MEYYEIPLKTRSGKPASPRTYSETVIHNNEPLNQILSRIVSSSGVQGNVGEIFWWPLPTPPEDALYCDGSAVSREEYADLFAVVGIAFGNGDGSTTFNLPDMRGEFVPGLLPCIRCKVKVLPRCIGLFQDRSLPANSTTTITPQAPIEGDPSMIVGDHFVAQERGVYRLCIDSARLTSPGNQQMNIYLLNSYDAVISTIANQPAANSLVTLAYSGEVLMEAGEKIRFGINSSVAQSNIRVAGYRVGYSFSRIA